MKSRVYEFVYSLNGVVHKAVLPAKNAKEAANRFRMAVEMPDQCKIHRMKLYLNRLSVV